MHNYRSVNCLRGQYGTALQAAAALSTYPTMVVQFLLSYGADVNAQAGIYGCALQAAANNVSGQNEATFCLLLENGADVNIQGGIFHTALQAASYRCNYTMV